MNEPPSAKPAVCGTERCACATQAAVCETKPAVCETDRLETREQIAARIGVTERALRRWLDQDPRFPRIKLTAKTIRFYWPDVLTYIRATSRFK